MCGLNEAQSTLFNALVESGKAEAANFPFCTIEPNVRRLSNSRPVAKSGCKDGLKLTPRDFWVRAASQFCVP